MLDYLLCSFNLIGELFLLIRNLDPLVLELPFLNSQSFVVLSQLGEISHRVFQSAFQVLDLISLLLGVLLVVGCKISLRLLLLDHV